MNPLLDFADSCRRAARQLALFGAARVHRDAGDVTAATYLVAQGSALSALASCLSKLTDGRLRHQGELSEHAQIVLLRFTRVGDEVEEGRFVFSEVPFLVESLTFLAHDAERCAAEVGVRDTEPVLRRGHETTTTEERTGP